MLDWYEDRVEIGAGGFGRVYRATDTRLQRTVALKVLEAPVAEPGQKDRFLKECRAAAKLSWHPNVVTVYEADVVGTCAYIAMEYCPDGSLAQRLERDGPLPVSAVVDIGVQIAGALESAHESGILHRDIKPENILIKRSGRVGLADFGVARLAGATSSTTQHVAISPLHAAPELLGLGGDIGPAVDIYELASTLHHLIAGKAPFADGAEEGLLVLLGRIAHAAPAPLTGAGVTEALRELILRCLSKSPSDRPQSAHALRRELEQIRDATDLDRSSNRTAVVPNPEPPPPSPKDRPARRTLKPGTARRATAASVVVLVGVGAIAVAAILARPDGGTDGTVTTSTTAVAAPDATEAAPDAADDTSSTSLATPGSDAPPPLIADFSANVVDDTIGLSWALGPSADPETASVTVIETVPGAHLSPVVVDGEPVEFPSDPGSESGTVPVSAITDPCIALLYSGPREEDRAGESLPENVSPLVCLFPASSPDVAARTTIGLWEAGALDRAPSWVHEDVVEVLEGPSVRALTGGFGWGFGGCTQVSRDASDCFVSSSLPDADPDDVIRLVIERTVDGWQVTAVALPG